MGEVGRAALLAGQAIGDAFERKGKTRYALAQEAKKRELDELKLGYQDQYASAVDDEFGDTAGAAVRAGESPAPFINYRVQRMKMAAAGAGGGKGGKSKQMLPSELSAQMQMINQAVTTSMQQYAQEKDPEKKAGIHAQVEAYQAMAKDLLVPAKKLGIQLIQDETGDFYERISKIDPSRMDAANGAFSTYLEKEYGISQGLQDEVEKYSKTAGLPFENPGIPSIDTIQQKAMYGLAQDEVSQDELEKMSQMSASALKEDVLDGELYPKGSLPYNIAYDIFKVKAATQMMSGQKRKAKNRIQENKIEKITGKKREGAGPRFTP